MLLIPLPLLIKARLPMKRKLVLCGVFSLGIFVILASILNRYYNFTAGYGSLIYLNWYAGEAATAVMVANIPHCWPILSRVFRLGSFKSTTQANTSGNRYKLSSGSGVASSSNRRRYDQHGYIHSDSEEMIAGAGTTPGTTPGSTQPPAHGPVYVRTDSDMELGRVRAQEPQIGTAVTDGTLDEKSYAKEGRILKTVSMSQTSADDPDKKYFQ